MSKPDATNTDKQTRIEGGKENASHSNDFM